MILFSIRDSHKKNNLKSHIGPTKKTSALIKSLKTVLKQGGKKIDYFLSGKINIFYYRKWSRQTFKDASIRFMVIHVLYMCTGYKHYDV